MREQTFPAVSIEDWKQKSEESLKGRKLETLEKNTFENIKLKPLYTKADQQPASQFPAQSDFRRGIEPLGYVTQGWKVAQKLHLDQDLQVTLANAFEKGQSAISFEVEENYLSQLKALQEFHGKYPYSLNAKEHQATLLSTISEFPSANKGYGFIGKDPVAIISEKGLAADTLAQIYDDFANTVVEAHQALPNIKTILVDTTTFHNGGANAVQELAIAVSTGVQHIEELSVRGVSLDTILSKLVFQFSIGSNFFMEVAKLRAARIIWSRITEAYGVEEDKRGMVISAVTSQFTKTVHDPYVNMLRAGNEAFAAVLGGIQYLHVSPFNEPEGKATAFSDRIARNTQLILKEEAHLTKTVDPAGGSWYVELLTTELAEKAWELFLTIEEKGGVLEGLKQGFIQTEISSVREKREEAIAKRKQTIVGTNKYADLQGESLQVPLVGQEKETGFIAPIPQMRLSQSYESLRERAKKIKPVVGLITLGSLKSHKARADFMTGFFAPGGIKVELSGEVHNADEALTFIEKTNYKHYCICGTNELYEEVGNHMVKKLKEAYPQIQLYLAGMPDDKENWEGIQDFIHVKSNCYETISSILDELEVGENE